MAWVSVGVGRGRVGLGISGSHGQGESHGRDSAASWDSLEYPSSGRARAGGGDWC